MFYKKGLALPCIFRRRIRTKILAEDHYLLVVLKEHAYPAKVSLLHMLILVDPIPRYPFCQKHLIHCSGFHLGSKTNFILQTCHLPKIMQAGYDGGVKWTQLFRAQSKPQSIITVFPYLGWSCGYSDRSRTTFPLILSWSFQCKESS